ncbi:SMP protein, partial [Odontophorus gujanensis]|nr:SMP protein [Odontophorus gujanensis]
GSRVELRCEAEGRPTPLLSWLRDSEVGQEEPTAVLSVTLPHAAPHDGALYVCVAENPHGAHNRSAAMRVA